MEFLIKILHLSASLFLGYVVGASGDKFIFSALLIFVPVLFFLCRSRLMAFSFIFLYYSCASRGVPAGAAVFFGADSPRYLGLFFWIAVNSILSLVWMFFWIRVRRCKKQLPYIITNLLLLFIALTLPPIGIISWTSPLVAAGYIFAGQGWLGILLFIVSASLAIKLANQEPGIKTCLAWTLLVAILLLSYRHSLNSYDAILYERGVDGWSAIDTHFGRAASGSAQLTDAFIRSTNIIPEILQHDTPFILVPETIAGFWIPATQSLWLPVANELKARKQTLVLGTEILDQNLKYDNCMLFLGYKSLIYRQRVPVPFSMWRPFGGQGTANAYWWESGLIQIDEKTTAAMLICYEQFLAWPVLRSMMTTRKVDLLITTANQWWSRGTCIPNIERQYAISWTLLFDLPLVTARNI